MEKSVKNLENDIYNCFPESHRDKIIILPMPPFGGVMGIRATQCGQLIVYFCKEEVLKELASGIPLQTIVEHEYLHYSCGHIYETKEELEQFTANKIVVARHCEVNSFLPETWKNQRYDFPQKYNISDLRKPWRHYYPLLPDQAKNESSCYVASAKDKKKLEDLLQKKLDALGVSLKLVTKPPEKLSKIEVNHPPGLRSLLMKAIQRSCPQFFDKYPTYTKPHKWKPVGLPGFKKMGPKILFAIDCSGSTTGELQKKFFSHTSQLLKEFNGDVLEFNDEIKFIGKKPTYSEWGGGTAFRPVQDYTQKKHYDLCVWFTDGEGTWGAQEGPTKHIVVLWGNPITPCPQKWTTIQMENIQ